MIVVVVTPAIVVAIVVMVPMMAVFETPVRTVPISHVESSALVTRTDPACSFIGRAGPIAAVPNVAAVYGIPVSINPDIFWSRLHRMHVHHTRPWRCTDFHTYRDLSERRPGRADQRPCQ